ncbi:MAG: ABC transporter ATP-binding protein [Thermoplasmata archaeon]|nr:ABC transporter ATP-binding protein [Thermoplasmata archaeon]
MSIAPPSSGSATPLLLRSTGPMLEVDHITKSYGTVRAVSDVSFSVPAGQIVGLLGPNGAGKSTTMKAILGLVRPEIGSIRVLGQDVTRFPVAVKRAIGYVPESTSLYEFLTGAEYLDFVADLYGLDGATRTARIEQFLTGLELSGHENSLISGYSQGMKQKVALIAGLVHHPRLLILDEPLNGLDPRSARVVKEVLRNLARIEGVGVLFSTHVLEIAQAICDQVVILRKGSVIASGTVDALRNRAGMSSSDLEDVFLSLTETGDLSDVVTALSK